jgi:hypothetical protein
MRKPAILSAALLAGSVGLTATAGWSGGGYHGSPSGAEQEWSSSDHVQMRRDVWPERAGGDASRHADTYSREGVSEYQRQQQSAGMSDRRDGFSDRYHDQRSAARDRDHTWNTSESKDDRDFHS